VGTGYTGAQANNVYIDDLSSALTYKGWQQHTEYAGTVLPPTITNTTFHASRIVGESVSTVFTGSAVVVYGPCYIANGEYTVSLDSLPTQSYNGSMQYATATAENCVRYMAAGLDGSQQHSITITNTDDGRWTTLDWIQVVQLSGGTAIASGSSGNGDKSSHKGANVGAIAGSVVGGLLVLIVLSLLAFFCLRRRNRTRRQREARAMSPSATHAMNLLGVGEKDLLAGNGERGADLHAIAINLPDSPASPISEIATAPTRSTGPTHTSYSPNNGASTSGPYTSSSPQLSPLVSLSPAPQTATSQYHGTDTAQSNNSSNANPSLSQISQDVNRILGQLGRFGVTPGEPIDEMDDEEHTGRGREGEGEVGHEVAPPVYGEHH